MRLLTVVLALGAVLVPVAPPVVDAGPPSEVEAAFRTAVLRGRGPRAGSLFTLPNPFNYICERNYAALDFSHIPGRGIIQERGTYHPTLWHYDSAIPLVFYGAGRVKPGQKLLQAATQQDLPATFAWLLHTPVPRDCVGKPLTKAFLPHPKPLKAILTIVLDQGGRTLFAAHPGRYPEIARLTAGGTDFVRAKVTNMETETGPGHVALGTGAYPGSTGIPANDFYDGGLGRPTYSFYVETAHSPFFLESPTLGDEWLRATDNQAIVMGQSQSDRAAIGMVGHGSAFQGNKKSIAIFYDTKTGHLVSNEAYYTLPDYLTDLDSLPYWQQLTGGSGLWMDHPIGDADAVRRSPALVSLEGDSFARLIANEPVGQDNICDLLYVSFKSSDAVGHRFGFESEEAGAVLAEIDKQVGRLVHALEDKAGAENTLVVVTADHGAAPLAELSGGHRLIDEDMLRAINTHFPSSTIGRPAAVFITTGEVWLDPPVLAEHGKSVADVAAFLRAYKVDGKPFYRLVLDPSAAAKLPN